MSDPRLTAEEVIQNVIRCYGQEIFISPGCSAHADLVMWMRRLVEDATERLTAEYDTCLTSWAELRQEVTNVRADNSRLTAQLDAKGTWPNGAHRAFVEGAAWGFWKARGATFFGSERDDAEIEAIRRYGPVSEVPDA